MNFRELPDEALLRTAQFLQPHGPIPYQKTRWADAVANGEAPQPVIRRHRLTVWRWGDLREWLIQQAAGGIEEASRANPKRKAAEKAGGGQ